jgi:hypothetical protein
VGGWVRERERKQNKQLACLSCDELTELEMPVAEVLRVAGWGQAGG